MAKLPRAILKLFGQNGQVSNFYQFGSVNSATPTASKDLTTIQGLSAWLNGLQDSVYGASKYPVLEEMNALFYTMAYQVFYKFQEGIAEWDAGTTYYTGSVVKKTGTSELYKSLGDANINHVLPNQVDDANWGFMNPAVTVPVGSVVEHGASAIPAGWLECDGSAVSRTTYAALYAIVGVVFGVGDGVNTFNVPDLRGRVVIGAGTGSGLTNRILATTVGEESHVLTTSEIPSHTHTITDPGHHHRYCASSDAGAYVSGSEFAVVSAGNAGIHTGTSTTGVTFANAGSGTAHNNIQPVLAVKKIIKY